MGATTVANQIVNTYNASFWNVQTASQQAHAGAVDGSSPQVGYTWGDGLSGGAVKYVRLDQVTYPNSRVVKNFYGTTAQLQERLDSRVGCASCTRLAHGIFAVVVG